MCLLQISFGTHWHIFLFLVVFDTVCFAHKPEQNSKIFNVLRKTAYPFTVESCPNAFYLFQIFFPHRVVKLTLKKQRQCHLETFKVCKLLV